MNETTTTPQDTTDTVASQVGTQHLTLSEFPAFKLGNEDRDIDILQVQEIVWPCNVAQQSILHLVQRAADLSRP